MMLSFALQGRWFARAVFPLAFVTVVAACGADRGAGDDSSAGGMGSGMGANSGTGANAGGNGGARTGGMGGAYAIEFPDRPEPQGGAGGSAQGCGQLVAIVRDFRAAHQDFENGDYNKGLTKGLVKPELDVAKKPVYAHDKPTRITSQETFMQWYRDVQEANMRFEVPLPLEQTSPNTFVFDDSSFFPLDDKGFGNEGRAHNFHFTTEIRGGFTYKGGEKFTFRGDDDVWVFVNGKLALDLGGVHGVATETIDFDARAAALGLEVGKTYTFDVFHAERHTNASNFRMETSIECLTVPVL